MSDDAPAFSNMDVVRQYLIDKARAAFGDKAVGRVEAKHGVIKLFFYMDAPGVTKPMEPEAALQKARLAFDTDVFDGGKVFSDVTVNMGFVQDGNLADERVYCMEIRGAYASLRDNISDNDPEGLARAIESLKTRPLSHSTKQGTGEGQRL